MTKKIDSETNKKAAVTSYDFIKGLKLESAISVSDYDTKSLERQLVSSEAVESLANDLTAYLVQQPRKIVKCVRCAGCGKPYAPSKMSQLYPICRNCLSDVRGKGVKAQSNFINRTINNFQIFLKGAITV